MRRYLAAVVVGIVGLALASCAGTKHSGTKKLPGVWQIEPITVDGNNKDWPSPYPEYDEKAQLGYAISNDKDNLYITVETGDPATQLKILREGLTVWIDKSGGKEQSMAINYPIPYDADKGAGTKDDGGAKPSGGQFQGGHSEQSIRMDLEDRVRRALAGATDYSLQGFKSCNLQYPLLEKDSCGIVVRVAIDADNEMIWEAVVPFKSFYYRAQVEKRDNGKPISVCFETVAMKRPPGQPAANNGRSGGGGGLRPSIGFGGFGGMGMGMNMGGGRGGNRNAPAQNSGANLMEPMYKSSLTWKTFGIAYP